jgi:hypothetical protein
VTRLDPSLLSAAIILWTGWGSSISPERDEKWLVDRFGSEMAAELLPAIRRLEDEFYESDARHKVAGLKEMGDLAASPGDQR